MRPIQDLSKFVDHIETNLSERDLMDLLARFDDAAIRTDLDTFRSLWTEDATWEIGEPLPMKAKGQQARVAALQTLQDSNQFFFRMTGRPVMTIDGDTASMRSPTVELAARGNGRIYANVAFYEDRVVRGKDGQCRFTKRKYRYIWVDTESSMPGKVIAPPTSRDQAKSEIGRHEQ